MSCKSSYAHKIMCNTYLYKLPWASCLFIINLIIRAKLFHWCFCYKYDSYLGGRLITNAGSNCLEGPRTLTSQLLPTITPLIARHLSGCSNYAW